MSNSTTTNPNMITLLNTSILTTKGTFSYESLTLEEAISLVKEGFQSAIGHQATAEILTTLLKQDVKMNRIEYSQQTGDLALVFKLNGRPEEGKILSVEEIESIGYEFGLLKKIKDEPKKIPLEDKNMIIAEICDLDMFLFGVVDSKSLSATYNQFIEKYYKYGMSEKELKQLINEMYGY